MSKTRVMVLGAGGFIGGHLCARLREQGHFVIGVDVKPIADWWQSHCDIVRPDTRVGVDFDHIDDEPCTAIVNLAADMGGMGYIHNHHVETMNSVDTTLGSVRYAKRYSVSKYVFASSACVYPYVGGRLREDTVYHGSPERGYGEEKLFSERYVAENGYSVVRFHNVYGPMGSWRDGREKAPAAICRKVAEAKLTGDTSIELWGQEPGALRTYLYVSDAVDAVIRMLEHPTFRGPVNVGSEELVSVRQLMMAAVAASGAPAPLIKWVDGPVGAPTRCSHNDLCTRELFPERSGDWVRVSLGAGIQKTYEWIESQLIAKRR